MTWPYLQAGEPGLVCSSVREHVKNPPEVNARKAGSAVPMKCSIGDGQDGHLRDLSTVRRLEYAEIPCDAATPEIVDALSVDDAGDSGLRYDASCEQFVCVWKTPRHPESSCVAFVLTLSDGTRHLAKFVLR